ncbi:MAG: hypothetical protein E4G74_03415, partial [Erysipelotrichales bacterium]
TTDALRLLKQKGIKLGLLTSRTPEETIHVPGEFIALMDTLLWSAGSVVVENNTTVVHSIDPDDVAIAIDYARRNHLVVRYSTGTEGHFDGWTQPDYTALFQHLYRIVPDVKEWHSDPCVNLLIFCEEKEKQELADLLKRSHPIKMPRSLEVTPFGIDKGTTLVEQCRRWNIPVESSIAFGDGINDICMLKAAGIGVAMGNANEEVKAAADMICGRIEDDGLYDCVKELGLL